MARFNSSFRKPRAMFIDLSGTIHVDDHAIPNSVSALKKLKDHRIPHIFVTNTSKVSQFILHEQYEIHKLQIKVKGTKATLKRLTLFFYRNLRLVFQRDFRR